MLPWFGTCRPERLSLLTCSLLLRVEYVFRRKRIQASREGYLDDSRYSALMLELTGTLREPQMLHHHGRLNTSQRCGPAEPAKNAHGNLGLDEQSQGQSSRW